MNNFVLTLINIIHFLVILFVVFAPFTSSTLLLLLHCIIVPFIMLHWLLNNDTCAITVFEKHIRTTMNGGNPVKDDDCFAYKIIGPIYNFMNDNVDYSKWTWTLTSGLWLVTFYKLFKKQKEGALKKILNI